MAYYSYHNQGATRNKPASDRLLEDLGFLEDMGVEMRIISGGQDAKGEGSRRTGSTRHDHGNAVDADFYIGGKKITPSSHPEMFNQIVGNAVARGVTGIGEGKDYMGEGRMHLGYGNPGVWGAGGKSANAPDWLKAAYNGEHSIGMAPGPTRERAEAGLPLAPREKLRKKLGLNEKTASALGAGLTDLGAILMRGGF